MNEDKKSKIITNREKLTIILVIFLIKMLQPWEFEHKFKEFWEEVKSNLEKGLTEPNNK